MLPEILRHLIDEFGRSTLIEASKLSDDGWRLKIICGYLGLPNDAVENCIQAGGILRRMAAGQRRFEDQLVG